jgi:hypothetical protein
MNIPAISAKTILESHGLIPFKQVMNYRGKIIALLIKDRVEDGDESAIYIPTYPSASIAGMGSVYIDDVSWNSYQTTRDRLEDVVGKTEGQIKCESRFKIVEDGLIVGILTNTNQFIPTDPPIQDIIEDGIESIKGSGYANNGYVEADIELTTSTRKDDVRIQTIQNISLESHFYITFRSRMRILLSDYSNKKLRDEIVAIIQDQRYLYQIKMKKIQQLLLELTADAISFDDLSQDVLASLRDDKTFVTIRDNKQYCLTKGTTLCLPKINLLSGELNKPLYFARMADELIRYKRIRLFLLEPKKYLTITNVDYSVNDDELILLQSILYGDYFDDLIPFEMNQYIQNIGFDEANPSKIINYQSNEISLEMQNGFDLLSSECILQTKSVDSVGGVSFPPQTKETTFYSSPSCSFFICVFILSKTGSVGESVNTLKKKLWKAYQDLFMGKKPAFIKKVYSILKSQGKEKMIENVVRKTYDFETMIMEESYFLTALDLWVLRLPIVLILESSLLVLGGDVKSSRYHFVRQNGDGKFSLITPTFLLGEIENTKSIDRLDDLDAYITGP